MREREFWYWLCCYVNLSVKTKQALLNIFKSAENIFDAGEKCLIDTGLKEKQVSIILNSKSRFDKALSEYHNLGQKSISFITINDKNYPERLKKIYEPPLGLLVKGRLPDNNMKSVAIIGARSCSHYGAETAAWFGRELAAAGVQVISGMALGSDSRGLCGAAKMQGKAFAVLGSGTEVIYPPENIDLYQEIVKIGGIISEYPPHEKPLAYHFPQRNRIISALADCVVVVEARKKSGSLITADLALEQGKDVAAVPGRHSDELSAGTNMLIKNGAYLVMSPDDVLDIIGVADSGHDKKSHIKNSNRIKITLDKRKEKVYSILHLEPKYIETIIKESGLGLEEVLEILVELEMDGLIKQTSKNYYASCIG